MKYLAQQPFWVRTFCSHTKNWNLLTFEQNDRSYSWVSDQNFGLKFWLFDSKIPIFYLSNEGSSKANGQKLEKWKAFTSRSVLIVLSSRILQTKYNIQLLVRYIIYQTDKNKLFNWRIFGALYIYARQKYAIQLT